MGTVPVVEPYIPRNFPVITEKSPQTKYVTGLATSNIVGVTRESNGGHERHLREGKRNTCFPSVNERSYLTGLLETSIFLAGYRVFILATRPFRANS